MSKNVKTVIAGVIICTASTSAAASTMKEPEDPLKDLELYLPKEQQPNEQVPYKTLPDVEDDGQPSIQNVDPNSGKTAKPAKRKRHLNKYIGWWHSLWASSNDAAKKQDQHFS